MDFKLKKSNLNFRVYTSDAIPMTGNENDIVIISNAPMTNWILSPDKPNGAPRTDGDVWVKYSVTGNTFNALKNNSMLIAPIGAWQYISGAWVDVIAKSWQNGEWVDWIVYLYNEGDRCVNVTGSWEANANMVLNGGANKPANVTFNSTNITTKLGSVCIANTVNKINVTPYSTLNFYVDVQENTISDVYGIIANYGDIYKDCAACLINTQATGLQTISIDISNVEGEYYVVCGSSNRIRVIHKVWLA